MSGMVNSYVFFIPAISILTPYGFTIALVHPPLVMFSCSGVKKWLDSDMTLSMDTDFQYK